jgi:hypothetical protein
MWFLLKAGFWFSAVLLVLPLFGGEQAVDDASEGVASEFSSPLAVYEAVSAMTVAIDDMRAICERHPDVCETGGEALQALGLQARDGARIALGYLDETFGETAAEPSATVAQPALADLLPIKADAAAAIPASDTLSTGTVAAAATGTAHPTAGGAPLSITVPVPVPAPAPVQ